MKEKWIWLSFYQRWLRLPDWITCRPGGTMIDSSGAKIQAPGYPLPKGSSKREEFKVQVIDDPIKPSKPRSALLKWLHSSGVDFGRAVVIEPSPEFIEIKAKLSSKRPRPSAQEVPLPKVRGRADGDPPRSSGAKKYDDGKLRYDLIPVAPLKELVKVLTFGARKYAPNNWQGVEPWRYTAALMRHVEAWRDGEVMDPESGHHHLAHAACCLFFLLWFELRSA